MTTATRQLRFGVIGAGMSGILSVIKLREAGLRRHHGLREGGPAGRHLAGEHLSRASRATSRRTSTRTRSRPNPDWTHVFSRGDEILAYFEQVARDHDVERVIRFGDEVTSCDYADGRWTVRTASGYTDTFDVVIAATGVLHHPAVPRHPRARLVRGRLLPQRAVGPLGPARRRSGSGSSAPAPPRCRSPRRSRRRVGHFALFQRTAQWVLPQANPAYTAGRARALRRATPSC